MRKNKYRSCLLLASIFACTLLAHANGELIAFYTFDDHTARDCSGYSYPVDGAVLDSGKVETDELRGNVLSLTGEIMSYVDCGYDPRFDISKAMTVSCWMKTDGFEEEYETLVAKGNSESWRMQRAEATDSVAFICVGVEGVNGTVKVDDGKWHHIAGVYDGSALYLYVDGQLDVSKEASAAITLNDLPVYIGQNPEWWQCAFKGYIDDVAIFNHALSKEEIARLYMPPSASALRPLSTAMAKCDAIVSEGAISESITLLKEQISEIEKWYESNPGKLAETVLRYPNPYLKLAELKTKAGFAKEELIDAYKCAVLKPAASRPNCMRAMLWLHQNMDPTEYAMFLRKVFEGQNPLIRAKQCAYEFKISADWEAFRLYLDAVFKVGEDKAAVAAAIMEGVGRTGPWAEKFLDYCKLRNDLTEYVGQELEIRAEEHVLREELSTAAQLFAEAERLSTLPTICAKFQYKRLKCIFQDGQYEQVIRQVDDFIRKNGDTAKELIPEVMLLKGRTLMLLEMMAEARSVFEQVRTEYPTSEHAAAALFLLGYSYALEGDTQSAERMWNKTIADQPNRSWAKRARLFLIEAQKMNERKTM